MKTGISINQVTVLLLLIVCLYNPRKTIGQTANGYFVYFSDKKDTPHNINFPSEFLSQRAIERREKQGILIDSTDLGVSRTYIDSLQKLNISILHTSKWLNGAIVESNDELLMDTLYKISFIKSIELSRGYKSAPTAPKLETEELLKAQPEKKSAIYGEAYDQIASVNGIPLHNLNYKGAGMNIAVIDAGFYKTNELPAFTHLYENNQILGIRDFVNPSSNIYDEHTHGMNVLSIIGGKIENEYCGTAPQASFWLLRTEDVASEFPIEADYWVCAAEFADSAGVDIINTSLGYTTYDNPALNLTPNDLNGNSRISKAANIAVKKGMVVVISAGNEGNGDWQYISTPSDASDVLCIGAITSDSTRASFSSVGYPPINNVKPDIMAMGVSTAYQSPSGYIRRGNGTSFSAPVISGMMACLWQSLPNYSAVELMNLVRESSHNYNNPNLSFGYGIPDFYSAYLKDSEKVDTLYKEPIVWPNPFTHNINIQLPSNMDGEYLLHLFNYSGKIIGHYSRTGPRLTIDNLYHLPSGLYLLSITGEMLDKTFKIIKR